jgi:hypothetical protein
MLDARLSHSQRSRPRGPQPPPPPHPTTDPARQGMGYWEYTLNELGIYDAAAQIDKLHEVKLQVGAEGGGLQGGWGLG